MHPTGGSLRVFRQFAWLEVCSVKVALSRPAHQRVTHTVRRFHIEGLRVVKYKISRLTQTVKRFLPKRSKTVKSKMAEIRSKVYELATIIGASKDMLPTFGVSEHSGRPHVEADANGYHFVVAERGQEFHRHTSFDIDEILYDVFQTITFNLACKYELNYRIHGQDFRRIMFEQQEELLSKLSPSWGERRKREHAEILQENPYNDVFNPVEAYAQELKEQGFPPEVRWKMARDKFNPPKEN